MGAATEGDRAVTLMVDRSKYSSQEHFQNLMEWQYGVEHSIGEIGVMKCEGKDVYLGNILCTV